MPSITRIPRKFYDDHNDRGLPAPGPVRESARFVWISTRPSKALAELIADARHYYETRDDDQGDYRATGLAAGRLLVALGIDPDQED